MENITGILIIGGKSSRMKQDKALLNYRGKPMAQWAVECLQAFCDKVIVASNVAEHARFGQECVSDVIGDGPIAGLYAGLKNSTTPWNFVLPADMPLVNSFVLEKLLDFKNDYDAVVAVDGTGKIHPLVGLYNKSIVDLIESEITRGKYSVMNILDQINVKMLQFESTEVFKNINAKEDLV